MRCKVQLVTETETGEQIQEMACLDRKTMRLEEIGLTLAEAKALLTNVQATLVHQQAAEYANQQRHCARCGLALLHKDRQQIVFHTLFGDVNIPSPRLIHCGCQPHETHTFCPLAAVFSERTAPERLYLETKWSSLVSYELTAKLLAEVLPLAPHVNAATLRNHLQKIAQRAESELGEEQCSFIDGCPQAWAALPRPAAPLTVGIDGGYVRQWEDKQKHFEVIVGKSMPEEGQHKRFGFVQTYDEKPKRRLFEVLKSQGLQMNQQITFISDGGDDVRALQMYLSPEAEHYLDWFHVTMRLTVMGQYVKGLPEKIDEGEDTQELRAPAEKRLERIKWYLWHGNVYRALGEIDALEMALNGDGERPEPLKKLAKALDEFHTYILANEPFIPNYGERWRNHDIIASGFVESTVNEVVSKRMVKKQQMQWTKRGGICSCRCGPKC